LAVLIQPFDYTEANGFTEPPSTQFKEYIKMLNIQNEISRELPYDAPTRLLVGGTPILYAFNCALLERENDKGFVYTAVNLTSGKSEVMSRRITPLTTREVEKMAERIHRSKVAGASRFVADRTYGERITLARCREILNTVFREILPKHGYAIRKEQISLADSILDTLYNRTVTLAEAEVGTGKTLAYLVAAILAKRGRLNDFWNKAYYPKMSYVDMAQMPIVIATSSIALQKAILTEYIPALSKILYDYGIIDTPITAVLRKGREHYVCERNLRSCLRYEQSNPARQKLRQLLAPKAPIDIAEIEGLDAYTKRKIAVPDKCVFGCPHRDSCAYLKFRQYASSPEIDIQVLNHNYFLADLKIRDKGDENRRPLIPNYQTVIIDEAHKFLSAARTMYGSELSGFTLPNLRDIVNRLNFKNESAQKLARKTVKKLFDESNRLFNGLDKSSRNEETDDDATRFTAVIDQEGTRYLRNLRDISDRLYELLTTEAVTTNGEGKKSDILWDLANVREHLASLARHSEHICWLEKPNEYTTPGVEQETRLCAIPKNLDEMLYKNLWSRGIPTVLTSGTLSTAGAGPSSANFSHIKRTLGLERLGNRLTETSNPSPFNHRENSLLYISEAMPFPDQSNRDYINAIADETERLIRASHGHAAVLFTSYKAMDMVWERLSKRNLPFPLHRLDKGGVREIEKFKKSDGGILFAAGALWEGIDIPGDALSMLIIVKLPFQVPDPIGEYEQTLYRDMFEYKSKLVVPEMLIKLKQGFGRLIRKESDTGVVAILDSRAANGGAFRDRVLSALPNCRVTSNNKDIADFIKAKKLPKYFN
jgi:ATP-dependent DNA helicase DinG